MTEKRIRFTVSDCCLPSKRSAFKNYSVRISLKTVSYSNFFSCHFDCSFSVFLLWCFTFSVLTLHLHFNLSVNNRKLISNKQNIIFAAREDVSWNKESIRKTKILVPSHNRMIYLYCASKIIGYI